MRLRALFIAAAGAVASLAGCAPPPQLAAAALPPNPYGYLRPAARCVTPPVVLPASGVAEVRLRIGNDGGFCALRFSKRGGGPFASFLVTRVPDRGKPLLYNYNNQSVVTYTPNRGYAGPDEMVVELVPGAEQPRVTLRIAITVAGGQESDVTRPRPKA